MGDLFWCQSFKVERGLFSYFYHTALPPTDLYWGFNKYKLSYRQLMAYGFPLTVPGNPGIAKVHGNMFSANLDPEKQVCRCGKRFSMLNKEWYVAKNGCFYHPGKKAKAGPSMGLFECCNTSSRKGCVKGEYHVSFLHQFQDVEFKRTEPDKTRLSPYTEVYALDTEMCFTTMGMEIVKVSLVCVLGGVLYTTFVKPKNKVLDYNTAFSGVSGQDLESVDTTLEEVQEVLLNFIHCNAILVGHSLENDLLALHLIHESIVDTSVVFPHDMGFPYKNSLKDLAFRYLGKFIQHLYKGHDSIEDARTSLELMLLKIRTDSVIQDSFIRWF